MKSLLGAIVAIAALPSAVFAINTYNIFTDATGAIQFYQLDGLTKFTESYTFEVGVFTPGTDFNDPAAVSSGFTSFGDSVAWDPNLLDTDVGGASLSFSFDEISSLYPAGITVNSQLAIWAYDSKDVSSESEWVVITNANWVVRPLAAGAAVDSVDYTITDAGTVYVYGSLVGNKALSEVATAVPEPSSFAAFVGLVVVGFASTRRRRSA